MNERIQKLYVETTGKDWVYDFDPDYAEKFAELIVKECIDVVDVGGEFVSRPKMVERLKQHFGIEE